MKENKYDDPRFFEKYSQMYRSQKGLEGAGEWETLKMVLPDFKGRRVLDLGCGYGWHCLYAAEQGAASVTGVDISEKMLQVAEEKTAAWPNVTYRQCAIEEFEASEGSFDLVLSSLALHYVEDFESVVEKAGCLLTPGGYFVFSMEHPIFTAQGPQDWYYDEAGNILHFPVDRYFYEGRREACFLGEKVIKYHRTLTTCVSALLEHGFQLLALKEPKPPAHMMGLPGMEDELRRPMMVIFSARRL